MYEIQKMFQKCIVSVYSFQSHRQILFSNSRDGNYFTRKKNCWCKSEFSSLLQLSNAFLLVSYINIKLFLINWLTNYAFPWFYLLETFLHITLCLNILLAAKMFPRTSPKNLVSSRDSLRAKIGSSLFTAIIINVYKQNKLNMKNYNPLSCCILCFSLVSFLLFSTAVKATEVRQCSSASSTSKRLFISVELKFVLILRVATPCSYSWNMWFYKGGIVRFF